MSLESSRRESHPPGPLQRLVGWIFLSPVLWGGVLTIGCYALIPYLPVHRELAIRYFCSHPLEYATASLFFVGIATLALKAMTLRREKRALNAQIIDASQVRSCTNSLSRAEAIEKQLQANYKRHSGTKLFERLSDVCAYVHGRGSSEALEEHVKYLADLAAQRLHDSYALVRNITWAVPIIGFLGTVIGITLAVANVTPEQLDSSLGAVTGGLAVAFDTTALSLALSLVLVFSVFVVERKEQGILAGVEEYGINQLLFLFPPARVATSPLAQAQDQAAERLLERTEALVSQQTDLWQKSLEGLRERWVETLNRQEAALCDSLNGGMQSTLGEHADQLAAMRHEFLGACKQMSQILVGGLQDARSAQELLFESISTEFSECWKTVRTDIESSWSRQRMEHEQLCQTLRSTVADWQSQLRDGAELATAQLVELRKQGELLATVVDQEAGLMRLQERLTQNLEALRATEQFEDTLHSLTAAVHLLTLRNQPREARDAA